MCFVPPPLTLPLSPHRPLDLDAVRTAMHALVDEVIAEQRVVPHTSREMAAALVCVCVCVCVCVWVCVCVCVCVRERESIALCLALTPPLSVFVSFCPSLCLFLSLCLSAPHTSLCTQSLQLAAIVRHAHTADALSAVVAKALATESDGAFLSVGATLVAAVEGRITRAPSTQPRGVTHVGLHVDTDAMARDVRRHVRVTRTKAPHAPRCTVVDAPATVPPNARLLLTVEMRCVRVCVWFCFCLSLSLSLCACADSAVAVRRDEDGERVSIGSDTVTATASVAAPPAAAASAAAAADEVEVEVEVEAQTDGTAIVKVGVCVCALSLSLFVSLSFCLCLRLRAGAGGGAQHARRGLDRARVRWWRRHCALAAALRHRARALHAARRPRARRRAPAARASCLLLLPRHFAGGRHRRREPQHERGGGDAC